MILCLVDSTSEIDSVQRTNSTVC